MLDVTSEDQSELECKSLEEIGKEEEVKVPFFCRTWMWSRKYHEEMYDSWNETIELIENDHNGITDHWKQSRHSAGA